MDAFEIATLPWQHEEQYGEKYDMFRRYVTTAHDRTVNGLVSTMAEMLQFYRFRGEYLGNNSIDITDCMADAQILLARVLLDKSSHGTLPCYVDGQLDNIAWDYSCKFKDQSKLDNWLMAQENMYQSI